MEILTAFGLFSEPFCSFNELFVCQVSFFLLYHTVQTVIQYVA